MTNGGGLMSIANLESQILDLKNTIEISKSFSSISSIQALTSSVLNTISGFAPCSYAALFLRNSVDSSIFSVGDNFIGDFPKGEDFSIDARDASIKTMADLNTTFSLQKLRFLIRNDSAIDAFIRLNPSLIVPLCATNSLTGVLVLGEKVGSETYSEYSAWEKEKILSLAPFIGMSLYNALLIDTTTTDIMTKLRVKHYFYTVLFSKIETSVGNHLAISVLMTDIDFFKKVNDTYGHAAGDYVLTNVARIVKQCIRGEDMAARYGGEEFVVMLYDTDKPTAMRVAERIRSAVENEKFVYNGQEIRITISIGVSSCQDKLILSAREMVNYADSALYASKKRGRNCVSFATEELVLANLAVPAPSQIEEPSEPQEV